MILLFIVQLRQYGTFAQGQQTALRVNTQFGAGVGDVEVAHGQLADAVERVNAASSTFSMLRRSGW